MNRSQTSRPGAIAMRAWGLGLALAVAGLMTSGSALAGGIGGCNSGCHPPAPPSPPTHPEGPGMPHGGGYNGGGGGNYNSNSNTNINRNTVNVNVSGGGNGSGGGFSNGVISGGGYSNWSQTPGYPQSVGLNVETAQEGSGTVVETVETVTETRGGRTVHVRKIHKVRKVTVRKIAHRVIPRAPAPRVRVVYVAPSSASVHTSRTITRTVYPVGYDSQVVSEGYGTTTTTSSWDSRETYGSDTRVDTGYGQTGYGQNGYATGVGLRLMAVEAACVDGSGGAQPAAPLVGEQHLDSRYSGEIYRCYAGTQLRARMAPTDGHHFSFEGARFLTCGQDEALWYEHGLLACRREGLDRADLRDLLRRYGSGVKIINVAITERGYRTVDSRGPALPPPPAPARTCNCSTNMVFDGGVGGFVQ